MDTIIESLASLIDLAQNISDGIFDIQAFVTWKAMVFVTLITLLGPFHYYTRKFCQLTANATRNGLLAGEGILFAVREYCAESQIHSDPNKPTPKATGAHSPLVPWVTRPKKWYSLDYVKSNY